MYDYGTDHFTDVENGEAIVFSLQRLKHITETYLLAGNPEAPCILFSRQPLEGRIYINHFSISSGRRTAKSRVIVVQEGDDSGRGLWKCSKDAGAQCGHITKSKQHLAQLGLEEGHSVHTPDNHWIDSVDDMPIIGTRPHFRVSG